MKLNITEIVRSAIVNNTVRQYQILAISVQLGVSKMVAKKIFFAFIYYANETTLSRIAENDDEQGH